MKPKLSEIIKVSAFVFLGLVMIYIVHSALTKLSLGKTQGYNVKALFRDLRQLQLGDDVRLAGVRVGSVADTYLENDLAVAILRIDKKYQIPEDSIATILMSGLLGANYVAITPGTNPKDLVNGALIQTRCSADLSSVINRFGKIGQRLDRILSNFDEPAEEESTEEEPISGKPTKGKSFFANLTGFFNENRSKMDSIIENLNTITTHLANGEGTVGKLLKEDKAYNDLLDMMHEIREAADKTDTLIAHVQEMVDKFQKGEGALAKLLSDEKIGKDVEDIVTNFREFSEKLNSDKTTLGRLITSDGLYTKAEDALNKVDKAADSINNNGPITAVGVAATALF